MRTSHTKDTVMNQKSFIFLSFLVILLVTTIGIVSAQKNQSPIKVTQVSQNGFGASTNRAERIINLRKRHQERNNTYQKIRAKNSLSKSYQKQQTTVNLSSSDLDKPNLLSISASPRETQLTAEISLNGQLIKSFADNHNVLDLSPYLTLGKQIVSISGNYTPSDASVKIELKGQTTHISQETKGSGKLQQQLIFQVK